MLADTFLHFALSSLVCIFICAIYGASYDIMLLLSIFCVRFLISKTLFCIAPGLHVFNDHGRVFCSCGASSAQTVARLVIPCLCYTVSILHLHISRLLLLYWNCISLHGIILKVINTLFYTEKLVTSCGSNTCYYCLHKSRLYHAKTRKVNHTRHSPLF